MVSCRLLPVLESPVHSKAGLKLLPTTKLRNLGSQQHWHQCPLVFFCSSSTSLPLCSPSEAPPEFEDQGVGNREEVQPCLSLCVLAVIHASSVRASLLVGAHE